VKNFKHVASFSFLSKGSNGKFEIGFCKVPVRIFYLLNLKFNRDYELNEYEKAYNDIIDLLDDQSTVTKSCSEEKEVKSEDKKERKLSEKTENGAKSTEKK